jgi:glycerol-3-phosphate dehydrogenase
MVVVCVLGIGRLGGNIAGDLAFNGHTVRAWDNDSNNLDKLHERINYEKKRLKEDKIMTYPEMLVNMLGILINFGSFFYGRVSNRRVYPLINFQEICHLS